MKKFFLSGVAMALGALACASSWAAGPAEGYPTKPVTLVVPFAPGGAVDIIGRLMAQSLSETLGKPVVVENKPGAGGLIAMNYVANAAADGYTLGVGAAGPLTVSPSLYATPAIDPLTAFEPVIWYASTPGILVVNPALKAQTLPELLALSRAASSPLTMGSAGSGSINHLMGEYFQKVASVEWLHIPYRGSSPALTDLVAGNIQVMMDIVPTAAPFIEGGKLRALAVTTPQRSAMLPDVPTMQELGYAGFDVSSWISLIAPKGTAPEIVAKLNQALNQGLQNAGTRDRLVRIGAQPEGGSPQRITDRLNVDVPRWKDMIESAGITVQ